MGALVSFTLKFTLQNCLPNKEIFSLPILKQYYWAANMRALMYQNHNDLFEPTMGDLSLWPRIEASFKKNISLYALLFSGPLVVDYKTS